MRQLAQPQKQWPDLRPKTLEGLAQKKEYMLLTEIYLEDGEIDQALEFVGTGKGSQPSLGRLLASG